MIREQQALQVTDSALLSNMVVEAIQDKKGEKIIKLDLRNIEEAVADYFIICEASNPVQVRAIAENVAESVKETVNERPLGMEGLNTGNWALVDFFNVVVHVFLSPVREMYQLEELWGDAESTEYEDLF